ncbi:hypothetical protein BDV30DRAFT_214967 [Aspergillus minisclerotigenes]|uniref:Uncharacterized protein n=1 Tax=Aspergillus minisclerotigenes TaxID=656917 RepID=A0A5N6IWP3_9EURO|nr:hypothetical protein BDV30DRAFT_214967 [Aspergillus minisclerotigenes]
MRSKGTFIWLYPLRLPNSIWCLSVYRIGFASSSFSAGYSVAFSFFLKYAWSVRPSRHEPARV